MEMPPSGSSGEIHNDLEMVDAHYIRYLGVILDTRLSFGKHVEIVVKKVSTSATALAWLINQQFGPVKEKVLTMLSYF